MKLANDQCATCDDDFRDKVTAEKFAGNMDEAIQRIKDEVPRVLVNVVGSYNVSAIYDLTVRQEYCQAGFAKYGFRWHRTICACFRDNESRGKMQKLGASYDSKTLEIYNKYKAQENESFAMRFTPPLFDISSFPLETIR